DEWRIVVRYLFCSFNDAATAGIYTLSLHDALPILKSNAGTKTAKLMRDDDRLLTVDEVAELLRVKPSWIYERVRARKGVKLHRRSEEHTSELQSLAYLVCRLLLEKKNTPDSG